MNNFSVLDIIEEREIMEGQVDSVEWLKEVENVKPKLQQIYKETRMAQPVFHTVDMEESFNRRKKITSHVSAVKFFSESEV